MNPHSHPRFEPAATIAINVRTVRHVERDHLWLMPSSVPDWLPRDHLPSFVHASMVAGADYTAGVKGSLPRQNGFRTSSGDNRQYPPRSIHRD